jgi:DNA primase
MANGRLTDASIAAVREAASIEQVVADYVTLKRAGSAIKGLCPFHDEKGASFHVTPERGYFHCFGCQMGGDVIDFIREIEGLDFVEAIERLAERFRVELTYEENSHHHATPAEAAESRVNRARLHEANNAAAAFYQEQLFAPEAIDARRYLSERNFDRHAAAQFGVGYSPNAWDTLIKHLTGLGFTPDEIATAGLTSETKNGHIDRFRGRLMFPIRDPSGHLIGFGARKLLSDEQDKGPKYLNTPETPIYKKSRVLYGLDAARKHISKKRRVVMVEGYTDVMACHLSGETTAVATCGTAFGEEHIRLIRRLLGDDGSGGEVIYTFDGDSAGQKAALRAFTMDSHFQTHTSVAVDPDGMDPCEVRIAQGPEGVLSLLENRIPLFEFALKSTLSDFDLRTPEGRANALAQAAPILADLKHVEMRDGYIRQLSRWTGTEQSVIRAAVIAAPLGTSTPTPLRTPTDKAPATQDHPDDPYERPTGGHPNERNALKVLLQHQNFVHLGTVELRRSDFAHPTHKAVWDALVAANADPAADKTAWARTVHALAPSPTVASVVTELSVDPILLHTALTQETAIKIFLTLAAESAGRKIDRIEIKIADPDLDTQKVLDCLADLERAQQRRALALARIDLP